MALAVLVLRQGMNVPDDAYVAQVVASVVPDVDASVPRAGLSQPTWWKNMEFAESAAGDAARAFAQKLALASDAYSYRIATGPDGANVMVVLIGE
jgi:hypothetical protein